MGLKIGIVGLPNVGKSTLFNALTRTKGAEAANYPFCTIEPNVGIVEVPDERMKQLSDIVNPQKIIPTIIEFVDIAGLVEGASKGEGLGNKFLAHIRECDAIAQVVRVFEDPNITHVHEKIDPKRDIEIIESELLLADLQTLESRLTKARTAAKSNDKDAVKYADLVGKIHDELNAGNLAHRLDLTPDEKVAIKDLHLLTAKPVMYIANMHENDVARASTDELRALLSTHESARIIPISARIEEELIGFSDEEAREFLAEMGLKETGLNALIRHAYDILDLRTYFTASEKEVRAWTIKAGDLAPRAAGVIHTDFEKGFIKAEVINCEHYINHGGETGAKEKGLLKIEGKDYEVQDGDVMHFRFSS
ncbi:redox-regulated ATPase YchF [Candidatus Peregrinibacteria bacterium CG22_combo_CG10-13_8_21_14_all_44_10]|nr:MAG: redox-regulated ATPase YchF [Candidatus Peregrinibacteria bacterium CG2_30_44_17]PIP65965.1 MAG: redox-regulated ATPase YchF [Candidatus Peregrinibacteria bacterium CG22_combo_CG10-13_8_21_14_all_44_10]PIS04536.1 MAG: redox-regulated ATPase YchF [Candidatus Peregrinibacteria bacterium CG10_big_fil_rev_8_21_14_0_10_44_7]PIX79103.1 MAG: redox-regulated ATPase YchF [Candidatus Peregrinibacteria bacterium CG_4_10_14_3_um_filter_44_21]PJB89579.1 MAG: redox-regulated ATPase YchF [Candidatus P